MFDSPLAAARDLIERDHLESAVERLLALTRGLRAAGPGGAALSRRATNLSGRLANIRSERADGLLLPEKAGVARNEIRIGLLALCDDVDGALAIQPPELAALTASAAQAQGASLKDDWPEPHGSIPVFLSCAHEDGAFCDQLRAALAPYERTGELTVWADRLARSGPRRREKLAAALSRAQVVILLLSPDFLSSSPCMDEEVPAAWERHARGECVIVPIVVRACRYDRLALGELQAILPGGKPVSEHENADRAWVEVTQEIDRVLSGLKRG